MQKRTILIVDDEKVNRKILAKLLQDEYLIMEAENGKLALDILQNNSEVISAVLLDIVMPVMDGYELMQAIREDSKLVKIPVIVSSYKDGDEAEIKALSYGAQDFIAKPYKAEIIRHRLSNLIEFRETASFINTVERDDLTGLFNKQFFMKNVSEWLQQHTEQQYAIMCIGIERFRLINESYGIKKGDKLLQYIADLIRAAEQPVFSTRFSADLFYLLIPHKDTYSSEKLRYWYAKVNEFPINMDIKLHCGIYEIEDIMLPVNVMCDRAQLASENNKGVYDAPFFKYDDSLRQKLLDEQFITSNMQTALKENQYTVYYQPKYDLNNELIAGAEALVRWIHPERGIISPGIFIPIFETNGFISELDHYVWEAVCRDIRGLMDQGIDPVTISINVSRADIYDPNLSDILLNLLAKYNIPIHYLHLEITESAYTNNPEQIIIEVDKLRKLGFKIEMDDFGSGYSSLNMLAEMPVDVLKLDMRFVRNQVAKPSGRGILSFVISLAKWLDLAVVAEGVETKEQIDILRSMDCNYVQGFYYAKPMPLKDFTTLLVNSEKTEMICTSQTVKVEINTKKTISNQRDCGIMLIVDDMELNRAVLASYFEEEFQIVQKENGREAWDYLKEHYNEVGIVMLDLLMPVMDGFQLLNKIRSDERMVEMPVIITSQSDSKSEKRALQMRADDFISKPYNPEIIKHRVDNVLASHELMILKSKGNL